jgi:hypothetical protein
VRFCSGANRIDELARHNYERRACRQCRERGDLRPLRGPRWRHDRPRMSARRSGRPWQILLNSGAGRRLAAHVRDLLAELRDAARKWPVKDLLKRAVDARCETLFSATSYVSTAHISLRSNSWSFSTLAFWASALWLVVRLRFYSPVRSFLPFHEGGMVVATPRGSLLLRCWARESSRLPTLLASHVPRRRRSTGATRHLSTVSERQYREKSPVGPARRRHDGASCHGSPGCILRRSTIFVWCCCACWTLPGRGERIVTRAASREIPPPLLRRR